MIFKKKPTDEVLLDKTLTLKEGFENQNKKLKILLFIFIFGSILERTAVALSPSVLYLTRGEVISKTMPIESFCEEVMIAFSQKHFSSLVIDPSIKGALQTALENDPISFEKIESLVVDEKLKTCKVVIKDHQSLRGFVLFYEKDQNKSNPFIYKLIDATEEQILERNAGE